MSPILVMAGGTGGHVFPALAVANELRRRGVAVVWIGSPTGMEAKIVAAQGFVLEPVKISGLRGKGVLAWLLAPWRLANAVLQVLAVLRRVRPRAVLGAGGFISGPGGIAAWIANIPLLIHEQNAVAGLTNRVLSHLTRNVFEAFPGSFSARVHARCIGNPVRPQIAALPAPDQRFENRSGPIRLLVLGGSQGAQRLNALLPRALARLPQHTRPRVRHQAGERGLAAAQSAYREANVDAQVVPFIEDMAEAYGWSDLAICRAGALTISELQAAGLAAVLVPFPAAVDDHQTKNAEIMVKIGAARLVQERDLNEENLSGLIATLSADRALLLQMARAARSRTMPDAAANLADFCLAAGAPA
jgi:UDP-N-acetylglucosamine--N-acetylmuramyl-(pentapeptide) pyrophosphoryl-undecaprenol N-acetylglucosamine transferase